MSPRKQGNGARLATAQATDTRGVARLAQEAANGTLRYETKNSLPAETRKRVIELLNDRLADCVDLESQCKQAHWNVKGPNFIGLHKLFDDIYHDVAEYVDLIAERVVQLGGIAEGTVRVAAGRSSLGEYPLVLSSDEDHVEALSDALAQFGAKARAAIEELDELEDPASTDMMTEISRGVDKWLWFVEAHRQGQPQSGGNSRR